MNTKINILIVDDHQIVIDGLKFMLEPILEFNIINAFLNAKDALTFLNANSKDVDIVIADINMPETSGIAFCQIVKEKFPQIKFLVLSMHSSSDIVSEAILAEADGYVLKNAGRKILVDAINKVSNDGMFFSEELIPIIYKDLQKEKSSKRNSANLSKREVEILCLIAQEYSSEQIADKLFISIKTVGNHRQNILEKCNCKTSIGLVKYAIKNNLISI